jgi:hypothetical protein
MNAPDLSGFDKIKTWLELNKRMGTYELAMIAQKSPSTIRNWKRRAGQKLKESPFQNVKHVHKRRPIEVIDDPSVWDNAQWFKRKYVDEGYGTPTIARIINRSNVLVVNRLKNRYHIKTRTHKEAVKSNSKLCNLEWLTEHYVIKRWSLKKCAQVAGVVPYTIYNWLIKFKLDPRSIHQAMAGNSNPFFGRKHSEETKEKIRRSIQALYANKQTLKT